MAPTKADVIRDYIARFPEMGPTDLARRIMHDHPDITVRSQEISTLRSRLGGLARSRRGSSAYADVAAAIEDLKRIVEMLGKEQVKRILEVL